MEAQAPTVVVIGLGYVGLPLAVALAKTFPTWGVDIDGGRIAELKDGHDRTGEIDRDRLTASSLALTSDASACPPADFYIVTVPTPVSDDNRPDLRPVMSATRTVAAMLQAQRQSIVVYESTVYPGVTEEICAPELEKLSGLVCGKDFFVGYSPERINPGDREHTIDRITKVVSGQTPEVLDKVAKLYDAVTTGGTFRATSIKAAEAAKVIENAQRDINIAFMNEITQIFARMGISIWDVLEAAGTKWNFLKFQPGLVGGHCIGVDPYYLSFRAEELGHDPRVILAGRSTNDGMADWAGDVIHAAAGGKAGKALVLGLTFKEDVPDIRNSKVADLVARLSHLGHDVTVHDPHADAAETAHEYGLTLDGAALDRQYALVVLAVPHQVYRNMGVDRLGALVTEGGTFADFKNCFPNTAMPSHIANYWRL
ncbi:nucleotide sugar dehydrogenase [Sphingomonas panni]|uniref:nucleotide sugar dehydrogenase n=1 Tax=Sphingomonas panni TaxID=237612 RepID=UPI001F5BC878